MALLNVQKTFMDNQNIATINQIQVEICDARVTPPSIMLIKLVYEGNESVFTVGNALIESGLACGREDPKFMRKGCFGVFGVRQTWDSQLYDGDRIEIYAPLIIDPKHARRKKANQNKDADLKAKALKRAAEKVEKSKI